MKWRVLVAALAAALTALALGFVIWANNTPAPMPAALAALQSTPLVEVSSEGWLVFRPRAEGPEGAVGFIFYPGGRVDPRSYAPAAHALAQAGYLTVIPPMPLNLAVFSPNRAEAVMAAFPAVERWAMGGHSLGGAMAASFTFSHPQEVAGLVLWAAYPAGNNSLATYTGAVTSIYATLDGLATLDKIEESSALLPEQTLFVPIQGGNHAQFGWYGDQSGDNPATISRESQHAESVAATLHLLAALKGEQP